MLPIVIGNVVGSNILNILLILGCASLVHDLRVKNSTVKNTIVGYIYDMLYGASGGYPSFASAAAIVLFVIVLTITVINLLTSKRVNYE